MSADLEARERRGRAKLAGRCRENALLECNKPNFLALDAGAIESDYRQVLLHDDLAAFERLWLAWLATFPVGVLATLGAGVRLAVQAETERRRYIASEAGVWDHRPYVDEEGPRGDLARECATKKNLKDQLLEMDDAGVLSAIADAPQGTVEGDVARWELRRRRSTARPTAVRRSIGHPPNIRRPVTARTRSRRARGT